MVAHGEGGSPMKTSDAETALKHYYITLHQVSPFAMSGCQYVIGKNSGRIERKNKLKNLDNYPVVNFHCHSIIKNRR